MDCALTENEKGLYEVWMHSPSVYGPDSEETILAWKIANAMKSIPSRVLRALRNDEGSDPDLVRQLEAFVAADSTLTFRRDGSVRRVTLVE